jgi:nicotinamidase-related amidase
MSTATGKPFRIFSAITSILRIAPSFPLTCIRGIFRRVRIVLARRHECAFHQLARALGVPVIHVRSTLRKGGVDDLKGTPAAWRRTFALHVGPIPNSDGHALEGSPWTEFVTEVRDEDFIVSGKKRLSAFYPTDLDLLLRSLGTKIVILNGGLTDCCVLNTAFDANNRDYRVIVARDLVRGTDADMEAAALKMISLHLGLVMDAADIASAWDARV